MPTKTEIKKQLKEELKCPADFIENYLNKEGRIDELKEAAHEHDTQEIMNTILDEYAEYCKMFELDINDDNTGFKRGIVRRK